MQAFEKIISEHQAVISSLGNLLLPLEKAREKIVACIRAGGKVFWMGNGGSAADAQHMAAELIGRFKHERRALPSMALTTDTSVLTCISNDYSFEQIFARQLEALCGSNDVVIGLSTSGNSPNVIKGMKMAQMRGAYRLGFTGQDGGELQNHVDYCFKIPSKTTARIQEAHALLCHALCEQIELAFVQEHEKK